MMIFVVYVVYYVDLLHLLLARGHIILTILASFQTSTLACMLAV